MAPGVRWRPARPADILLSDFDDLALVRALHARNPAARLHRAINHEAADRIRRGAPFPLVTLLDWAGGVQLKIYLFAKALCLRGPIDFPATCVHARVALWRIFARR